MLAFIVKNVLVPILLAYFDRKGGEAFKTKSLPAREKLRAATTAREARDAAKSIHQMLAGGG
jgi:hypothetical protein